MSAGYSRSSEDVLPTLKNPQYLEVCMANQKGDEIKLTYSLDGGSASLESIDVPQINGDGTTHMHPVNKDPKILGALLRISLGQPMDPKMLEKMYL